MSWDLWVAGQIRLQPQKSTRSLQRPERPEADRVRCGLEPAPVCVSLAFPPNRLGSAGSAGGAFLSRSGGWRARNGSGKDALVRVEAEAPHSAMCNDRTNS